jgi:hypothetical protein
MLKPEQTNITMDLQQMISWDPGGNQGFLDGNTTAIAASENSSPTAMLITKMQFTKEPNNNVHSSKYSSSANKKNDNPAST